MPRAEKGGYRDRVIFGMGGVAEPEDVQRFRDAGADVVQATTAFLHDLCFAARVRHVLAGQPAPPEGLKRSMDQLSRAISVRARELGCGEEDIVKDVIESLGTIGRRTGRTAQ